VDDYSLRHPSSPPSTRKGNVADINKNTFPGGANDETTDCKRPHSPCNKKTANETFSRFSVYSPRGESSAATAANSECNAERVSANLHRAATFPLLRDDEPKSRTPSKSSQRRRHRKTRRSSSSTVSKKGEKTTKEYSKDFDSPVRATEPLPDSPASPLTPYLERIPDLPAANTDDSERTPTIKRPVPQGASHHTPPPPPLLATAGGYRDDDGAYGEDDESQVQEAEYGAAAEDTTVEEGYYYSTPMKGGCEVANEHRPCGGGEYCSGEEEQRSPCQQETPPRSGTRSAEVPTPLRHHTRDALENGQTVVIFDWDDTLLSSTYLASLGYRLDLQQSFPPDLQEQLDELEKHVILLLQTCIDTVGAHRTVIITNAERGWVELSAKKFIPRVCEVLDKCHVISARTTFEIDNTGPYEWKIMAFYQKLQQSFGVRFPPPYIGEDCPYYNVIAQQYEVFAKKIKLGWSGDFTNVIVDSDNSREYDSTVQSEESSTTQDDEIENETSEFEESVSVNVKHHLDQATDGWVTAPGGGLVKSPFTSDDGVNSVAEEEDLERIKAPTPDGLENLPPYLPRALLLDEQNALASEHSEATSSRSGAGGENSLELNHKELDSCYDDSTSVEYQQPGQDHSLYIPSRSEEQARKAISNWHLGNSGLEFCPVGDPEKALKESKYVISFGDSLAEKNATKAVTLQLENSVFKTIKFMERPTIGEVIRQIDLVLDHLQFFVGCEGPLDIVLALDGQA